jgi:hypothetical protein
MKTKQLNTRKQSTTLYRVSWCDAPSMNTLSQDYSAVYLLAAGYAHWTIFTQKTLDYDVKVTHE